MTSLSKEVKKKWKSVLQQLYIYGHDTDIRRALQHLRGNYTVKPRSFFQQNSGVVSTRDSITKNSGFYRAVTSFISSVLHSLLFKVQPLISTVFIPLSQSICHRYSQMFGISSRHSLRKGTARPWVFGAKAEQSQAL